MLKGGLPLRNTQVGVQEDCGCAANHCAVHSAHYGHMQITYIDEALTPHKEAVRKCNQKSFAHISPFRTQT